MFVFNKPWKKQAMLINAVSLLSVVFLLLLIEQVNTEGINIKLDMEGDDVPTASEGEKDALLTTDPPTTTTEDTTTKAATSATLKKEAPRRGMFANAMNGFENLARRRSYEDLTPKERKEMKEAAPFVIVFFVIIICCCCACIVGVVALTIKAVSKKETRPKEVGNKEYVCEG
ncbi:unnamed protein product [Meloidogyne enterolobii]|uniref:Uncharacterized protein n=1 Tax=Meloidogyne enterolobii TaxID=390850 RepID=A0ACB0XM75_MELEN